tara:strand:- start:24 stop:2561 length:2538 start_codon:yes stop_codon:yes gene_type:complete
MSNSSVTSTSIRQLPAYMQDYDEALLAQIFGTPDEEGVLQGGIMDAEAYPDLFNVPDYVQAGEDPLQTAVYDTFDTNQERQAFMDRANPYFMDETGKARYLPDAADQFKTGDTTISGALTDYFPDAQNYLDSGTGGVSAKAIYDRELKGATSRADKGTQAFDATGRGSNLYKDANKLINSGDDLFKTNPNAYNTATGSIKQGKGEYDVNEGNLRKGVGEFDVNSNAYKAARNRIKQGQGQYDVNERNLRKGTGTYGVNNRLFNEGRGLMRGAQGEYDLSGGLGDARDALSRAGSGEFGAREAFERGTGRAFELAEQGLGKFDPASATQDFMDPYKSQVVDAAMDRINREGAKQRQADSSRAIGAGAFGGSRAGVQAAETQRAIEETKQSTIANLMSQGYDKSLASAMSTDEAARGRALKASGLTGELGARGTTIEQKAYEDAANRGLAAASTSAGLSQTEEQLRAKAYEDAKARGLTGAQLSNAVAETMNKLGMSAYESGATRKMNSEQMIEAARSKAFEDGKARGLTGAQLESSVAQAIESARQNAFESSSTRTMTSEQMIESARSKAYEDGKNRGLTGAQLESSVAQAIESAKQNAFESSATRTMNSEQMIEAARSKAYEDGKNRGLTGAKLEASIAEAVEGAKQSSFEDREKRQLMAGSALGDIAGDRFGTEASSFEGAEDRMLKAADLYRTMGISSAEAEARAEEDEYNRNLEAGRLTGGLGSAVGQLGGAQADIGKGYGALAGTSADIGSTYAGMAPADLNFMYGLGGKKREYDQQSNDYTRQNTLNDTQQTLAPYSYAQNFLTGAPSASMYGEYTSAPSQAPNPFLQGVGMYATYQGAQ